MSLTKIDNNNYRLELFAGVYEIARHVDGSWSWFAALPGAEISRTGFATRNDACSDAADLDGVYRVAIRSVLAGTDNPGLFSDEKPTLPPELKRAANRLIHELAEAPSRRAVDPDALSYMTEEERETYREEIDAANLGQLRWHQEWCDRVVAALRDYHPQWSNEDDTVSFLEKVDPELLSL